MVVRKGVQVDLFFVDPLQRVVPGKNREQLENIYLIIFKSHLPISLEGVDDGEKAPALLILVLGTQLRGLVIPVRLSRHVLMKLLAF